MFPKDSWNVVCELCLMLDGAKMWLIGFQILLLTMLYGLVTSNLSAVLERLQHHGVCMKKAKCRFMQDEVVYLGHKIDSEGLSTTTEKVEAVVNAPEPHNVQQLCSFLGLVNYYRKFLPNLSTILRPLNALLQKHRSWRWTPKSNERLKRQSTL